jgi:uncharacterized membrane protein
MNTELWRVDPWTLAAIVLMGLATYACRGGGYWLFRQISPSPLIRAILAYVPGTLFVSFVVPAVIHGGLQPAVGTVATLLVMIYVRNIGLAIAAGVLAAWGVWLLQAG